MKRKVLINISFGVVTLVLMIWIGLLMFIEPWVANKIENGLNDKFKDYSIKIGSVNLSIIKSSVEFQDVNVVSRELPKGENAFLNGEILSIKLSGIRLFKAIFKNDYSIRKVIISDGNLSIKIPLLNESLPKMVSPFNIRIGSIVFNKVDLSLANSSNVETYVVKKGVLKILDLQINKQDTISSSIVNNFDFGAEELISVSPDSLYTFKINAIRYSTSNNILTVNNFSIQPNYSDYDYTSRFKFQTNRIEANFSNISALNLDALNYLRFKSIMSSYVEIGEMDLTVFRDKRKEFHHVKKATFQDMIYSYPGVLNIDSIGLDKGNIKFVVHADGANQPGWISFNEIHARIFKISNEEVYKTKNAFFELHADALLMGKSKLSVLLRSKLFDNKNTFTVSGSLAELEVKELNPILEKAAFIYATSGKIDAMNFNFTANNDKAKGSLKMLYDGLSVTLKNKRTDDTTAFAEKFISAIANYILFDSNPIKGKETRIGVIDFERDPEKFLFNYCFKSILSGIESSLVKRSKKSKGFARNTSIVRR